MKRKISLIVAMSKNRVIGRNNHLPWNIPEDMAYFRRVTLGHTVIMGRKTFESMGKPLPGRQNIVLSRREGYSTQGITGAISLDTALALADPNADEVFVIGGSEIFNLALPMADLIYVTLINRDFRGDAYFPEVDPKRYREIWREDHLTAKIPFSFLVWEMLKA